MKQFDITQLKKVSFDDLIGMTITLPGCQRPSDNQFIMFKVAKIISAYNTGVQIVISESGNYYTANYPQLIDALEKFQNVESIVSEPRININGKFQGV